MCGIAGFCRPGGGDQGWEDALRAMTSRLRHRGPDDEGIWVDLTAGVALGHRRLAIVDLSPLGRQPMISHSGRYILTYNGEVYNHLALRAELERPPLSEAFVSTSDTEVILAAIDCWGVEAALKHFVGMLALGVWDRREQRLYLARDRMGEKPLYFGWVGSALVFASELKAFTHFPGWNPELNRDAVALLLRYGYIPAPHTVYRNVYKLSPATLWSWQPGNPQNPPRTSRYWSLAEVAEAGRRDRFVGTEAEAAAELEQLLAEAIRLQMVADVPVGAFLSGGIDSSTIVALMQAQSAQPVRTFSIGFQERNFNEAPHAQAVAQHLGTRHTETYVTPQEALVVVPRLPELWDEPFADSSQIPTYLVAALARRDVTVSLSGDAGDELFGGYDRYLHALQRQDSVRALPTWLRAPLMRAPSLAYRVVARTLEVAGIERAKNPVRHLQAVREAVSDGLVETYRRQSMSHWQSPAQIVLGANEPETVLSRPDVQLDGNELVESLTYLDLAFYLPEDILVKVDRASMAVSLESRMPLLDHRVVEFSQRLPANMKVRDGQGKRLLRQVLHRYVPEQLVDRPKMGFGVPLSRWLREGLRDWAADLLEPRRLMQEGVFDPEPVQRAWAQHQSGARDTHYLLWDVLMFQQWYAATRSPQPA